VTFYEESREKGTGGTSMACEAEMSERGGRGLRQKQEERTSQMSEISNQSDQSKLPSSPSFVRDSETAQEVECHQESKKEHKRRSLRQPGGHAALAARKPAFWNNLSGDGLNTLNEKV